MAAAIERIESVPVSACSTPRMSTRPTAIPNTAAASTMTSHVFSVLVSTKFWYPPSAARRWVMACLLPSSAAPGPRGGPALRSEVRWTSGSGRVDARGRSRTGADDTDFPRERARKQAGRGCSVVQVGRLGVGAGDELVVGVQDGQAAFPGPDHALRHQPGTGLDARDRTPALEDEEDRTGLVDERRLEVGCRGPGGDPDRLHP